MADLQRVTGKTVMLHEQVDPTILGGAIARVGDTLIDGSVRRRAQLLRAADAARRRRSAARGWRTGADKALPALARPRAAETPFVVSPSETDDGARWRPSLGDRDGAAPWASAPHGAEVEQSSREAVKPKNQG